MLKQSLWLLLVASISINGYAQDPNAQNNYAIQYEPSVYNGGVTVWFGNRSAPFDAINAGDRRLLCHLALPFSGASALDTACR